MNYSNSQKEESFTDYGFLVSGMLVFTILIILFIVWIKRKRRNLEIQYLLTAKAHEFYAWKSVDPRIMQSTSQRL